MSNLLIDERPLVVLPSLAVAVGLTEAIFLQQLHFCLGIARMRDGRRWFTRTYKEWCAGELKFISVSTLKRTVEHLRQRGLIVTTDAYNDPDDRTLWYTIDYDRLAELDIMLPEKAAPSAEGQSDTRVTPKAEKAAPSAEYQSDTTPPKPGVNLTLSPLQRSITPPPPTPNAEHLAALAVGGVEETFRNWAEHLGLRSAVALNLTAGIWASWVDEGLADELAVTAQAVILMGTRANDPAALLAARLDKQRHLKSARVAAGARTAALDDVTADLPEGLQVTAPTGQILTIEYVQDGQVFWREANAIEAAVGTVLRWPRVGGQA